MPLDLFAQIQSSDVLVVVWGQQDRMVPVEGAFAALWNIPRARVHIWGGGTGHFVEYEQADEFNRLASDFLTHAPNGVPDVGPR